MTVMVVVFQLLVSDDGDFLTKGQDSSSLLLLII